MDQNLRRLENAILGLSGRIEGQSVEASKQELGEIHAMVRELDAVQERDPA